VADAPAVDMPETETKASEPEVFGSVRTPEGVPIEGAEVRAISPDGPAANTGVEGWYSLPAQPGSCVVRASADGCAAVEQRVAVSPLGARIDFVLHPSAPILGRVVDQQGMPVEGARLRAARVDETRVALNERATDADGAFAFDDAYAGEWWLSLLPPDEGVFAGGREILVAAGGPPLRLVLRRQEAEHRLVLEAVGPDGTERPITAAYLWVDDRPFEPLRAEIAKGSAVVSRIAAGRWLAEISTASEGTVNRVLDIPPGTGEARLRIEIGKRGTITGRADVTGLASPPSDLSLSISPRRGASWVPPPRWGMPFAPTDSTLVFPELEAEDGFAFRLESVAPGEPVDISVTGDGCYGRARVMIESGGQERVVVRMRPTGTLRLRVANPPAVRQVYFEFMPEGEAPRAHGTLAWTRGVDVIDIALPAGRARWRATWLDPLDGSPVVREGEVTIEAGAVTAVEADLR
jgi:hypothetical protein